MSQTKSEAPQVSLLTLRDAREGAIARLTDAFAHDVLELDEFERRLSIVHRSESLPEISSLTADLTPTSATATQAQALSPAGAAGLADPRSVRPHQKLLAILGGTTRSGHWTPARQTRIVTVMGGVELDFREAALAPGVTELHITTVMGGVNIVVPPHLAVEMDGSAIMGGFEHSERAPLHPDPDRPILRVHGLAVMGGVHIETRLVGESHRESRRRARRERHQQRTIEAAATPLALPPRREDPTR